MSDDRLVRALVDHGYARVLWVDASDTVARMAHNHGLDAHARALAGELAVATLLMSAWVKGDERITLQLQADVPDVSFLGEADAEGHFRGWLAPAVLGNATHDVQGMLLASKADGKREMYRGVTEVPGVPVAEALDQHLRQSDQVDALLRLEVTPSSARGVLIERLPALQIGEPEDHHATFEAAFGHLRHEPLDEVAAAIEAGVLSDLPVRVEDTRPAQFQCRCSDERVAGMLAGLGPDTLEEMIREDDGAEVRCHFCNHLYLFDGDSLRALAARVEA